MADNRRLVKLVVVGLTLSLLVGGPGFTAASSGEPTARLSSVQNGDSQPTPGVRVTEETRDTSASTDQIPSRAYPKLAIVMVVLFAAFLLIMRSVNRRLMR